MQAQLALAANAFSKRCCRLEPPVSPELVLIHFPLRRLNPSHLATWKAKRVADSLPALIMVDGLLGGVGGIVFLVFFGGGGVLGGIYICI